MIIDATYVEVRGNETKTRCKWEKNGSLKKSLLLECITLSYSIMNIFQSDCVTKKYVCIKCIHTYMWNVEVMATIEIWVIFHFFDFFLFLFEIIINKIRRNGFRKCWRERTKVSLYMKSIKNKMKGKEDNEKEANENVHFLFMHENEQWAHVPSWQVNQFITYEQIGLAQCILYTHRKKLRIWTENIWYQFEVTACSIWLWTKEFFIQKRILIDVYTNRWPIG